MKNKSQPTDQERRAFLRKSSIVGAGVAATSMASTQVLAEVNVEGVEKPAQKGYQLTQHVIDYYKSADV